MGITSYCTTPASMQELFNALLPALESHTALPTDQTKDILLDILLAEDNKVNQKLAVRLLEGCGHKVEIADKYVFSHCLTLEAFFFFFVAFAR